MAANLIHKHIHGFVENVLNYRKTLLTKYRTIFDMYKPQENK